MWYYDNLILKQELVLSDHETNVPEYTLHTIKQDCCIQPTSGLAEIESHWQPRAWREQIWKWHVHTCRKV